MTALLLRDAGASVVGVHMKNWDASDELGEAACPADADADAAAEVAAHLGIPLERADFVQPYWTEVFEPWIDAHSAGLTPNPDTDCNRHVKFDAWRDWAQTTLQAGAIATGHYAQLMPAVPPAVSAATGLTTESLYDAIRWHCDRAGVPAPREATMPLAEQPSVSSQPHPDGWRYLHQAVDPTKDQSLFLSCVRAAHLKSVLFPLGCLMKSSVRAIAAAADLPNALRKDSTGICFVGPRKLKQFLPQYLAVSRGQFIDVDSGQPVGEHPGAALWTEGQGAKIGGAPGKYIVVGKHVQSGKVAVALGSGHPATLSTGVQLGHGPHSPSFNWLCPELPAPGTPIWVRLRHQQQQLIPARVVSARTSSVTLEFEQPSPHVAPGQVAALYTQGGVCFGGGAVACRYVSASVAALLSGALGHAVPTVRVLPGSS